eukprot:809514-Rhodomonas_salina.1
MEYKARERGCYLDMASHSKVLVFEAAVFRSYRHPRQLQSARTDSEVRSTQSSLQHRGCLRPERRMPLPDERRIALSVSKRLEDIRAPIQDQGPTHHLGIQVAEAVDHRLVEVVDAQAVPESIRVLKRSNRIAAQAFHEHERREVGSVSCHEEENQEAPEQR